MNMTKRLGLAAVALAGLSAPALAAGAYSPRPYDTPAVAPAAVDWDGAYVGAQLGYGWGSVSPVVGSTAGGLVGVQAGYNFHFADTIVGSVEGDIGWSNESAAGYRVNWTGSVRGRVGLDVDGILPYAEAGVAFANATLSGTPDATGSHTGWTVGAGIEFLVADQVSANVEYRYADYGAATYGGTTQNLTDGGIRAGLNYHF